MNPDQILAQQQAMLDQAVQNAQTQAHQWTFIYLALFCAVALIQGWVLYMFYARLRDISVEIRKFRIAYEFSDSRESRKQAVLSPSGAPNALANPFSQAGDAKYQPKSREH